MAKKLLMDEDIKFRPHHFLCSVGYEGMGYSKSFIANYDRIIEQIRRDEDTAIKVIFELDDICSKCPEQNPRARTCNNQTTIDKLDQAHAAILKLKDQEIVSFRDAKARIKEHFSLEQFHIACKPCEWQKMGTCEKALQRLRAEE